MDSFESRCWLDWWANPSTLLGSAEATVVITPDAVGWTARGSLTTDDDRTAFAFLCDLDPVFILRFSDESTIEVTVHPITNRHFTLTQYSGPRSRPFTQTFDL